MVFAVNRKSIRTTAQVTHFECQLRPQTHEIELINCIRYRRDMDMDHVLFIVRVNNISSTRVCNQQQQRIVQTFNEQNLFIICSALCRMNIHSV